MNTNAVANEGLALGDGLGTLVPNPFFGKISTGSAARATIARKQLLSPHPPFAEIAIGNISHGASACDALQRKIELRFSGGLSFLYSFSLSKLMDDEGAATAGFP
jgi:hypothetical protein